MVAGVESPGKRKQESQSHLEKEAMHLVILEGGLREPNIAGEQTLGLQETRFASTLERLNFWNSSTQDEL